jgi:hypothetical protein
MSPDATFYTPVDPRRRPAFRWSPASTTSNRAGYHLYLGRKSRLEHPIEAVLGYVAD